MSQQVLHLKWNEWHRLNRAETFLSVFFSAGGLLTETHDHNYYEMFLVLGGAVGHRINGVEQTLSKGEAVLIRPADRHCFFPVPFSGNPCFVNIEITAVLAETLLQIMGGREVFEPLYTEPCPPTMSLTVAQQTYLEQALLGSEVLRGKRNGGDDRMPDVHLRAQLCLMLAWYAAFLQRGERADVPAWFAELCREMKKPENFSVGLSRMRELSGKSQGYLCYCFRQYSQMRPLDFLNAVRLDYCAYMLCHTNRDILELLYAAGYDSPSNFYHLFQKRYQTSPARYRKRYRAAEQIAESGLSAETEPPRADTVKGKEKGS